MVLLPPGMRAQPLEPSPELRAAVMQACRGEVLDDVMDDARDGGFGRLAEVALFEAEAVFFQEKKDRIKVEGRGEFRYGPDYLMQPMSFTCEWDPTKHRLRKGDYRMAKGADVTALPPHKAAAVEGCKRGVREEIERVARMRSYWSPAINVRRGVQFDIGERGVTLMGEAGYKLDSVQDKESIAEYRCYWDPEEGRLVHVETRPQNSWQREIGTVTCESRNMARKTCTAPIGGPVRVQSNLSDTRCAQGINWAYTSREIVVWDGCRARFEFEMR
jgi:hypothetical protein